MKKMSKKCSTDQRFIRKKNTTYKIHTLVVRRKIAQFVLLLFFFRLEHLNKFLGKLEMLILMVEI